MLFIIEAQSQTATAILRIRVCFFNNKQNYDINERITWVYYIYIY